MRLYIIFILYLFLPSFALAQKNFDYASMQKIQHDSLKILLNKASNDTLRMDAYRRLGFYFAEINRDSSLRYGQQQLLLAKKLKQRFWEAIALNHIGYIHLKNQDYPIAIKFFIQAKEIAEDISIENNIWGLTNLENPRETRLRTLNAILNNFANLNGALGNLDKQLILLKEIYTNAESSRDNLALSVSSMNIGRVYFRQNKLDSALLFEKKALQFAGISGYAKYKGGIASLIGEIYKKTGKFELAESYYRQSIKISKEQRNLQSLGEVYINVADFYLMDGRPDSAIRYTKKGLSIFQDLHSFAGKVSAYNSFYRIYKKQHKIDSAFFYLDKIAPINDSLAKEEKEKLRQVLNISFNDQLRLEQLEKEQILEQGKVKLYAMQGGLLFFLIIGLILYLGYHQKRQANLLLNRQNEQIRQTLADLKATQNQLIQKEKLASLGELTAGIAHEIQNPLNFVNNFAEVSIELSEELEQSLEAGNSQLIKSLSLDLRENMQQIAQNGQRASTIVQAMLEHSQTNTGERRKIDINALAEEYLKLAYHGFRAKDSHFIAKLETDFGANVPEVELIVQEISRVLLNLYNNALYALWLRQSQEKHVAYEPMLRVSTRVADGMIELLIQDNGTGIPVAIQDKIFQPFFTTKPAGQGTGLGLSLSYDIITKGHGGQMWVESQQDQGTTIVIQIPTKM